MRYVFWQLPYPPFSKSRNGITHIKYAIVIATTLPFVSPSLIPSDKVFFFGLLQCGNTTTSPSYYSGNNNLGGPIWCLGSTTAWIDVRCSLQYRVVGVTVPATTQQLLAIPNKIFQALPLLQNIQLTLPSPPTFQPTASPSTQVPTPLPSVYPTPLPSVNPTFVPSFQPSSTPTQQPTQSNGQYHCHGNSGTYCLSPAGTQINIYLLHPFLTIHSYRHHYAM